MLPVSWVYMSTQKSKGHDQQVAQILIFLPMVVAGIVLVVQNSLALAFSLAGVVAAVRFRSTMRDARDLVFIFLAIGVGFAAGALLPGPAAEAHGTGRRPDRGPVGGGATILSAEVELGGARQAEDAKAEAKG